MKKLVLLFCLISFSVHAFFNQNSFTKKHYSNKSLIEKGGAMDGGGAGANYPESGAAWFYQDNPKGYISACIKRESNFKADTETIEKLILKSFDTWRKYLIKTGVYNSTSYDDDNNPVPYHKFLKILSTAKIEECSPEIDITFYFGTINKEVQSVLDTMVSPKAFAFRSHKDIDSLKGTSKGILWIFNPENSDDQFQKEEYNWADSDKLQAMINHEVGHMMGVPHIEDTIMRSELRYLFSSADYHDPQRRAIYRKYLKSIDHEVVLLHSTSLKITNGSLGVPNSEEERKTFELFMKRKPSGKVNVSFGSIKDTESKYGLSISDTIDEKSFHLNSADIRFLSSSFHNNEIFKRYRKQVSIDSDDYTTETRYTHSSSKSSSSFTTSLKLDSKNLIIDLNYNPGFTMFKHGNDNYKTNEPLMIFYIHKNQKKILFVKNPKKELK